MRDDGIDSFTLDRVSQSASAAQNRPWTAGADRAQVVDCNPSGRKFVSQSAGKTDPKVWFHLRAEVARASEREQISLDPSKEIPGCNVKDFHRAAWIAIR